MQEIVERKLILKPHKRLKTTKKSLEDGIWACWMAYKIRQVVGYRLKTRFMTLKMKTM